MPSLEAKVPPPAILIIMALFMWLLSRAAPALRFDLPANAIAFVLLPAYVLYINRFQIKPEERVLTSLFGETYLAYQTRARRWL